MSTEIFVNSVKEVTGMAIKDTIGAIAKTVVDKTGDVVETTSLSIKVNEEKNNIKKCLEQVGEYYYKKFADGEAFDSEIMDIFCQIKDAEERIASLQAQKEMVKDR